VFTPVLAKHSKSLWLIDCISVGVDRMQRNFEPMRKQVEAWQALGWRIWRWPWVGLKEDEKFLLLLRTHRVKPGPKAAMQRAVSFSWTSSESRRDQVRVGAGQIVQKRQHTVRLLRQLVPRNR
jgi:hypothetical protein